MSDGTPSIQYPSGDIRNEGKEKAQIKAEIPWIVWVAFVLCLCNQYVFRHNCLKTDT